LIASPRKTFASIVCPPPSSMVPSHEVASISRLWPAIAAAPVLRVLTDSVPSSGPRRYPSIEAGHKLRQMAVKLEDGGDAIHTNAQITGKAASMGEGVMVGVLDALIEDFTGKLSQL
jgi:hypothetical protein